MTVEQMLVTQAEGSGAEHDALCRQIAATAVGLAKARYAEGCLPEGRATLLFPAGSELRRLNGAIEPTPVDIAVGLIFGPAKRLVYPESGPVDVPAEDRFKGVMKAALIPANGETERAPKMVEVGELPKGRTAWGVPVASFYPAGIDCGVGHDDGALQTRFERNYLSHMQRLVDGLGVKDEEELRLRLETLGESAQSLRPLPESVIE